MRYFDTGFTSPSIPLLLRRQRKAAGLTQAQVAARMGTTQSAISRAEALDGPDPTMAFLERFAVATGRTLNLSVRPAREGAPRPAAAEALAYGKRLRTLARRVGCAWISVVDPSLPGAATGAGGRLHLVVRTREHAGGDSVVETIRRAAERTLCEAVAVSDIDSIRPLPVRARIARSRRTVARLFWNPAQGGVALSDPVDRPPWN